MINKKVKNIIAIVPARKGSVRVKNKNLKNFNNKPLIYWTLKNIINSKFINKSIISSDSNKILNYCKSILDRNTETILSERPKKLSLSKSKIEDVIRYEIIKNKLKKNDYIILLQPTSPLRSTKLMDLLIQRTYKNNLSNLVTVHSLQKTKVLKKKILSLKFISNSKDLFVDGDIYIFKISLFLKKNQIISDDCFFYKSKSDYSDIDYLSEFNIKN